MNVLLSFDAEEFDVPLEHQINIPFEEQIKVSNFGINRILDCLQQQHIKATFFCTVNFVKHAPDALRRMVSEGHEIASHGVFHSQFDATHLKQSKEILQELSGQQVVGFRMPRMMPVAEKEIFNAGYIYNSSLNPTFIPGRYMHLNMPRTYFIKEGVYQIPTSVTPVLRFPLFWLSYHNLPVSLYRRLVYGTLKHDGYFTTYFHPWEFYELNEHPEFKLPFIIRHNSGAEMVKRLNDFITYFKKKDVYFITYNEFVNQIK